MQQEIAKEELKHWLEYVERRKDTCKKLTETWIEEGSLVLLKEAFDRQRNRDTQRVHGPGLIEAHGMFAKGFTFKVPISPRNLSQMIHPHQGYMASMPDRGYTWEEMV